MNIEHAASGYLLKHTKENSDDQWLVTRKTRGGNGTNLVMECISGSQVGHIFNVLVTNAAKLLHISEGTENMPDWEVIPNMSGISANEISGVTIKKGWPSFSASFKGLPSDNDWGFTVGRTVFLHYFKPTNNSYFFEDYLAQRSRRTSPYVDLHMAVLNNADGVLFYGDEAEVKLLHEALSFSWNK